MKSPALMPRLHGTWYSEDPEVEFPSLEVGFLEGEPQWERISQLDSLIAAVLPHAGHRYSGAILDRFYSSIPAPQKLVIASPSHYEDLQPGACIAGSFERVLTPWGEIDYLEPKRWTPRFQKYAPLRLDEGMIQREHGIEMHLPFIARYWSGTQVGAVVLGSPENYLQAEHQWQRLMEAYPGLADGSVALIASSDLVHYGAVYNFSRAGASESAHQQFADRANHQLFSDIMTADLSDFLGKLNEGTYNPCGIGPLSCFFHMKFDHPRAHLISGGITSSRRLERLLKIGQSQEVKDVGFAVAVQGIIGDSYKG